jgi:hypothetical protein
MKIYHKEITDYMQQHPRQYIYVDDIKIDLLIPKSKIDNFRRSIEDLILTGRLEACGNRVRINQ